jgi:hypothetical protein
MTTAPAAPVELTCPECGDVFTLEYPSIARLVKHYPCPECSEKHALATQRAAIERSLAARPIDESRWQRICPPGFLHTEPHKLPYPTRLDRVLQWQYGPKGLILYGHTGAGKSRCLYMLLKREFDAGRSIRVLSHNGGIEYAALYDKGPDAVKRWQDNLCSVDLLALDDAFKAKLTDSFEQLLFTVVSNRTERGLPVIVTLQDMADSLLARMSADRGPAFIRRIREFCDSVSFAKP